MVVELKLSLQLAGLLPPAAGHAGIVGLSAGDSKAHAHRRNALSAAPDRARLWLAHMRPPAMPASPDLWRCCHGAEAQRGQRAVLRLGLPLLHHLQNR